MEDKFLHVRYTKIAEFNKLGIGELVVNVDGPLPYLML